MTKQWLNVLLRVVFLSMQYLLSLTEKNWFLPQSKTIQMSLGTFQDTLSTDSRDDEYYYYCCNTYTVYSQVVRIS